MKHLVLFLTILTGLIFSGCGHTSDLSMEPLPENQSAVNYSVTYYIHADSDYLYHGTDGKPVRENSKVLTTAFEVAEAAHSGEVFIYHQRPERKLLGLFPRKQSRLYHYKNGQLISRVKYRHPDKQEAFLDTEVQLMNKYRAQNRTEIHQNYFLYFGHEIPSGNGKGYHQTLPDINVNTAAFSKGIQNLLLTEEDRYNLVVLSTCNNGTPSMANHLIPFTDLMLASPQNLHLSHVDSESISILETEPDTPPFELAGLMADQTYQRLSENIHTTITLALYELEDVQDYIEPLNSLQAADEAPDPSVQFQDNVDCIQSNSLEPESYLKGVEAWFKPSRFGRKSGGNEHSGWGCKPVVK